MSLKDMSLMLMLSFGGIFVLVHDCVAWSKGFEDEIRYRVVSPHAFAIDRSRGPCCGPDFKLCSLYSLIGNGKAARFPRETK